MVTGQGHIILVEGDEMAGEGHGAGGSEGAGRDVRLENSEGRAKESSHDVAEVG